MQQTQAAEQTSAAGLFRHDAGGTLLSRVSAHSEAALVEVVRRSAAGPVRWQYRQPKPSLMWFRNGMGEFRLDVDGQTITGTGTGTGASASNLLVIPADTSVAGEFRYQGEKECATVLLNSVPSAKALGRCLESPFVGVASQPMRDSMLALCKEVAAPDNLFDLLAESWVQQALVHLTRATEGAAQAPARHRGGLTNTGRRRIEEFIRSRLADKISVADLTDIVGLGPRHFTRAFSQSFRMTPMQFILELRFEEAKRLLLASDRSVTDIAYCCGFSHAQHFTSTFRKLSGTCPTEFRRMAAL